MKYYDLGLDNFFYDYDLYLYMVIKDEDVYNFIIKEIDYLEIYDVIKFYLVFKYYDIEYIRILVFVSFFKYKYK